MAFHRRGIWVIAAFALYFTSQAALRIWLGGALEVDEAEMVLIAKGWQLGYGPQLPLYNWIQVAAFRMFGLTTVALAVPKNIVLWLAACGLFMGLRRVLPFRQALAGALSLAFLPNVVWEFQRASTHSIALLAMTTWTIAAGLIVLNRGLWRDWFLFGIVLGLGGLSKANYWLVPVTLLIAAYIPGAGLPNRPRLMGILGAAGLAALIVALPYAWVLQHPDVAMASSRKMFRASTALPPGIEGLGEALAGIAGGLLPVLIVAFVLHRAGRGRIAVGAPWVGRLLIRAGGIGLVLSCAGILVAGVSQVQARWLVPSLCLLASGLMVQAARRASPVALRYASFAAIFMGILTLGGMAELRTVGRSTGRIDFAPLASFTDDLGPDVIRTNFLIGGNLQILRPELRIVSTDSPADNSGLMLTIMQVPKDEALPVVTPENGQSGGIDLPYLTGATPPFRLGWSLESVP